MNSREGGRGEGRVRSPSTRPRTTSRSRLPALMAAALTLVGVTGSSDALSQAAASRRAWASPRHDAPVTMRPLWSFRSDELLYPSDIHPVPGALLVFDHGAHTLRRLDTRTRRLTGSVGRQGSGPGEFRNPVQILGNSNRILLLEFSVGRITEVLTSNDLRPLRAPPGRRWGSGCVGRGGEMLLQVARGQGGDFYAASLGDSAALTDSAALPWPALEARPFLERQAALRQLDDSTCVILPLYQREFAVLSTLREPRTGMHIEELPRPVQLREELGAGWREYLTGAKPGALDARAWRDNVLVLFAGQSRDRIRTIDVYRRSDLRYRGSLRLAVQSTRIAVRGDTLFALGDDDGEPVIDAYLLVRKR